LLYAVQARFLRVGARLLARPCRTAERNP